MAMVSQMVPRWAALLSQACRERPYRSLPGAANDLVARGGDAADRNRTAIPVAQDGRPSGQRRDELPAGQFAVGHAEHEPGELVRYDRLGLVIQFEVPTGEDPEPRRIEATAARITADMTRDLDRMIMEAFLTGQMPVGSPWASFVAPGPETAATGGVLTAASLPKLPPGFKPRRPGPWLNYEPILP